MVDSLYYGSTCPCCAGIQDANLNISFDEDMLAEVLEEIYNEKVKPAEGEIPRKYYEANRDKFEEATAQGMAQSQNPNIADDKEFLKKYRHSIDVFSAFRSHAYAKRLADELYDSEGRLRPFEEWRKATESIQSHFNKNWLQTEYNTAVLRAEQAADWRHFEDNKEDFPCLKWMPTSSATPREQHKAFWDMGLTLPVDDKFWDKHHPGDLWNCKCYLEPTTAEPTPKKRIPKEKDAPKPAKGLESNPGKKAEMYSRNHPYYPQPATCIWLKLAKGGAEARLGRFFNAEEVKCPGDCNEKCKYFDKFCMARNEQNKKNYGNPEKNKYRKDKGMLHDKYPDDFVNCEDEKYHDRLFIDKKADLNDNPDNIRAAKDLLNNFKGMEIEINEMVYSSDGKKNPEYRINGLIADRKSIKSENGVANGFKKAKEQGCQCVVIDLTKELSSKRIKWKNLALNITNRSKDFQEKTILKCYVVFNGNAVEIALSDFKLDGKNNKENISIGLQEKFESLK